MKRSIARLAVVVVGAATVGVLGLPAHADGQGDAAGPQQTFWFSQYPGTLFTATRDSQPAPTGVSACGVGGLPDPAPDGQHVTYTSGLPVSEFNRNCNGKHVFVAASDGTSVTDLTASTGDTIGANSRWSPDGTSIAWLGDSSIASPGSAWHLWVTDVASGTSRKVVDRAGAFAWSPDGTEIATTYGGPGRCGYPTSELTEVIDVATGDTTVIEAACPTSAVPSGSVFDWGSRGIYTRSATGQVGVVQPDGSGYRVLIDVACKPSRPMRLSPDEQWIIGGGYQWDQPSNSPSAGCGQSSTTYAAVARADGSSPWTPLLNAPFANDPSFGPVRVDRTAPTVTGTPDRPADRNGWYSRALTVTWKAVDDHDGSLTPPAPATLSGEGRALQVKSGQVCDRAGNCAVGTAGPFDVDTTAPRITVAGVAQDAAYVVGGVPQAACTASDPPLADGSQGSGLDGACSGSITGDTPSGVGSRTYSTSALDQAGNRSTAAVTFRITYDFRGFLQPVNDTAHQTGQSTSIFKAGSTVPLKFQIYDATGAVATPSTPPTWITPTRGAALSGSVNESEVSAPTDSGSVYRLDGSTWQYNWKTQGLAAGYYYRVGVRLDDGTTQTVAIGLR